MIRWSLSIDVIWGLHYWKCKMLYTAQRAIGMNDYIVVRLVASSVPRRWGAMCGVMYILMYCLCQFFSFMNIQNQLNFKNNHFPTIFTKSTRSCFYLFHARKLVLLWRWKENENSFWNFELFVREKKISPYYIF